MATETGWRDDRLRSALAQRLRELDTEPLVTSDELWVRTPVGGELRVVAFDSPAAAERAMRPTSPYSTRSADDVPETVVGLPYVGRATGQRLREQRVQYLDAGGNAWITQPGFYVRVEGRPNQARAWATSQASFRPSGMKVIFALLVNPALVAHTIADIADAATVSTGAVSETLAALRRNNHVISEPGGRYIRDPRDLTQRWLAAYPTALLPHLKQRPFGGPDPQWWLKNGPPAGSYLGGEVALEALGLGLHSIETLIYADSVKEIVREAHLNLRESANTIVRELFWNPATAVPDAPLVPPLLIYADAVASGDPRQEEAARLLWDTHDELRPVQH
ncbi:type IV toxin-antitoxin system AbiEi family antitoxin [Flexivirga oryzae]|uniref:Transcriptional regulator n=1 Tax=Flexivirga oryzae TaxID=1794944 RepID=A0A839NA90_9MICO|nr:type IV toxin-antitoxin system AbiEi family antitoxin [Flexivirga oryzae]MBB2893739.1 hypothetical protein [Flexivirga oryzae]